MTHTIETRGDLPTEMQALLRDYPRDTWPGHPNFAASIQNWLGAHAMFRDLTRALRESTEDFVDNDLEDAVFLSRLARYGNALVSNLHGHHTWEDRKFFPELRQADRRFDQGIDLLESDHEALDQELETFTRDSNRVIQLHSLDPTQVHQTATRVLDSTTRIEQLLTRHLADEEDLAVPILLHHKLRG